MIKRIALDLDGSLLFTQFSQPDQDHIRFSIDNHGLHYTILRPCAKRLIEFSRKLVGEENVFILTAAVKDYACEINRLAEWNFKSENILTEEDILACCYPTAYGGTATVPSKYADPNNVLIDNLDPRRNAAKISFLGIWKTMDTNYFKVNDYFGCNFPNDTFESDVKEFLEKKHNAPSLCPN